MEIVIAANCKKDPGTIVPLIDLKRCEGKADCVTACPENVFEIRQIEPEDYQALNVLHKLKLRVHGMKVAYAPNADACKSCGLCVRSCPEKAITLTKAVK